MGPALSDDEEKVRPGVHQGSWRGKAKIYVGPLSLQDGYGLLKDGEQATDDHDLVLAATPRRHGRRKQVIVAPGLLASQPGRFRDNS